MGRVRILIGVAFVLLLVCLALFAWWLWLLSAGAVPAW